MKTWRFAHKGHSIEVINSLFREKLIVDGDLQDEHAGLAFSAYLHGRLKSGDGAGEVIKASLGGFWSVGCIVFIDDAEVFRS